MLAESDVKRGLFPLKTQKRLSQIFRQYLETKAGLLAGHMLQQQPSLVWNKQGLIPCQRRM